MPFHRKAHGQIPLSKVCPPCAALGSHAMLLSGCLQRGRRMLTSASCASHCWPGSTELTVFSAAATPWTLCAGWTDARTQQRRLFVCRLLKRVVDNLRADQWGSDAQQPGMTVFRRLLKQVNPEASCKPRLTAQLRHVSCCAAVHPQREPIARHDHAMLAGCTWHAGT